MGLAYLIIPEEFSLYDTLFYYRTHVKLQTELYTNNNHKVLHDKASYRLQRLIQLVMSKKEGKK